MGPGGRGTLLLLAVLFIGLVVVLAGRRRWPLKLLAALGAFVAAAAFGVSGVNAYYGYFQTWGDVYGEYTADHSGTAPVVLSHQPAPSRVAAGSPSASPTSPAADDGVRLVAARTTGAGRSARFTIPGRTGPREVLVWLPPQYDQPAYAHTRFPVMVFLHGEPGNPESLRYGLGLPSVLDSEVNAGGSGPMVVLMPDIVGTVRDQQCLDDSRGEQLEQDLTVTLPQVAQQQLRVLPPGPGWVVSGLSEGGFCAADLALRHPGVFAGAGVEDGYFTPSMSRTVRSRLLPGAQAVAAHDPQQELATFPPGRRLPQFWVLAGTGNSADYHHATAWVQALSRREPVRFVTVLHGRHLGPSFRAGLPDLYRWAWSVVDGHPLAGQLTVAP